MTDGKTWTSRKLTDVNLYAVARTKDGGGSRQVQDAHTQSTLRAIHFVADHRNPSDVWSVAQSGTTSTLRGVARSRRD